ncbi:MAG: LuxR C-terminal-related transcriptional regulator [Gammaproteobacteria bacterium]
MESITLFIVHPDRIVRESLSTVLMQHARFIVTGTSDGNDSSALIESLRIQRVGIVILDAVLAQGYGPAVIEALKSSRTDTRVLVTDVPDRDAEVLAAIELGATGYETRNSSLQNLIANIHALMLGQTLCSPRIARMLFSRIARNPRALTNVGAPGGERLLTRRELQITALIDAGLTNKEIARRLALEVQTVKNHVHNILDKLNVRRRIEAARYVRDRGLLSHSAGTSPIAR